MKPKTRAGCQGRALHNTTFYDADLQELFEEPSAEAVGVYAANAALETREQQQQARRLAEAGAKEIERIKAALEPRRPPKETKPRARDPMKNWVKAGRAQLRRGY